MLRSLVLTALLLAPPALAQSSDPADVAYEAGMKHYDLREWDQAIEQFKAAHKLRPEPRTLFNIAQSYRLKGDCIEALSFYKTYRRNYPDAPNRDKVQKLIDEVEPCAKQAEKAKSGDDAPMGAIEYTPPPPKLNKKLIGLITAGSGVLMIGTGVYFGIRASSYADDVDSRGGEWDPDLQDSGEQAELVSRIMLGLGGAALVTGGIFYYLGHRDAQERATIKVVPTTGGAAVVWGGPL